MCVGQLASLIDDAYIPVVSNTVPETKDNFQIYSQYSHSDDGLQRKKGVDNHFIKYIELFKFLVQ